MRHACFVCVLNNNNLASPFSTLSKLAAQEFVKKEVAPDILKHAIKSIQNATTFGEMNVQGRLITCKVNVAYFQDNFTLSGHTPSLLSVLASWGWLLQDSGGSSNTPLEAVVSPDYPDAQQSGQNTERHPAIVEGKCWQGVWGCGALPNLLFCLAHLSPTTFPI